MAQDNDDLEGREDAETKNNFSTAMNELFGLNLGKKKKNELDNAKLSSETEGDNIKQIINGSRTDGNGKHSYIVNKSETVISEDTFILGEIQATNDVNIAGSIKGDVSIGGDIFITGNVYGNIKGNSITINNGFVEGNILGKLDITLMGEATVLGDIQAKNFVSAGKVKGNVTALNQISLKNPAVLVGNIEAKTLTLEEGVIVDGNVSIISDISTEEMFQTRPFEQTVTIPTEYQEVDQDDDEDEEE